MNVVKFFLFVILLIILDFECIIKVNYLDYNYNYEIVIDFFIVDYYMWCDCLEVIVVKEEVI